MTLLEGTHGLFGAWRLLHFDRTSPPYSSPLQRPGHPSPPVKPCMQA